MQYYLNDHLGSARMLYGSGWAASYYPFGELAFQAGSEGDNRYDFTGHERDRRTGLLYAGARYYNPWLGRWLSVDTLGDSLLAFSPYHYSANNPINYLDPYGLFFIIDDFIVGFVTGLVEGEGVSGAWERGTTYAGNSAQLWSSFARGSFRQIVSKFTWELPQQLAGVFAGHVNNIIGNIEDISHSQGATLIETKAENWGGYTLGSIITADRGTKFGDALFQHEYGHYMQSQIIGPTYFLVVGLPSLVSATVNPLKHHRFYTETWADRLAKKRFGVNYRRRKP